MRLDLDEIFDIFATRGHAQYGGEPMVVLKRKGRTRS
jgi:hypothetical protein